MAAAGNFFPLPQPSAVLLASKKIRYSVRMAARGESRMAFMDGYKPETMATTTEKATAPALSHTGMTERMPISVRQAVEAGAQGVADDHAQQAPKKPITADSLRNMLRMLPILQPSTLNTPISLVRS